MVFGCLTAPCKCALRSVDKYELRRNRTLTYEKVAILLYFAGTWKLRALLGLDSLGSWHCSNRLKQHCNCCCSSCLPPFHGRAKLLALQVYSCRKEHGSSLFTGITKAELSAHSYRAGLLQRRGRRRTHSLQRDAAMLYHDRGTYQLTRLGSSESPSEPDSEADTSGLAAMRRVVDAINVFLDTTSSSGPA